MPPMLSHGEFFVPISLHKTLCDMVQVIDLNTFSTEELQQAMQAGLRYDGVWMIPENSPQVHTAARALVAFLRHTLLLGGQCDLDSGD